MLRRIVAIVFLSISPFVFAGPLWHCIASNDHGAVWNRFANTRERARLVVEKECVPFNHNRFCHIVCFPPRNYWRCVSHDTLPTLQTDSTNQAPPKQGSWFWTSFSKQVAINGARDACRHNSAFGGCYVDIKACASSDNVKSD